jgi:hypothetical protein
MGRRVCHATNSHFAGCVADGRAIDGRFGLGVRPAPAALLRYRFGLRELQQLHEFVYVRVVWLDVCFALRLFPAGELDQFVRWL